MYSHREEGVYFHIALFPPRLIDFVTKLSRIHGNIMRTNQVTGNIIVSTCCLGDMAVNAPSSSGCALGLGGGGAFTAISPSQTCATYYIVCLIFMDIYFGSCDWYLIPIVLCYKISLTVNKTKELKINQTIKVVLLHINIRA